MRFEAARKIADAVLLEGYVLYPYRASAPKNRYRWPFGVLAPRSWSSAGGCEPWWMECQCLVEGDRPRAVERLRFLQVEQRRVERLGDHGFESVESLEVGGEIFVSFLEGIVREVEHVHDLGEGTHHTLSFELPGGHDEEELAAERGELRGRIIRERRPLSGLIRSTFSDLSAERPLRRLTVRVENRTPFDDPTAPRDLALPASCVASHLLIGVSSGELVSLLDPPAWAKAAAESCKSVRTHPVLAGEPGARDLLLSAPIILYDHPQVAPESPGDFFDGTEIDELLALRAMTLTEEEKREARATDPRAAAVIDRSDSMPDEVWDRLHGALRDLHRAEMVPKRPVLEKGSRVRLVPGKRRTDAQDLLFAGCTATVEEVKVDVEGRELFAVTIDDDPAKDLHRWYGRFHYYYADEVEPLSR